MAGRPKRPSRRDERDSDVVASARNFLVDRRAIARLFDHVEVKGGERVVDIGAAIGALALPCADAGARVIAIECGQSASGFTLVPETTT
jgi:16S rRNA A1518/A1519 N6-dimethyltransferase RsmA/KsgA/DIM1 with predicted DNA glycosylase/AP lyase activity